MQVATRSHYGGLLAPPSSHQAQPVQCPPPAAALVCRASRDANSRNAQGRQEARLREEASASRPRPDDPAFDAAADVPEVGWLWSSAGRRSVGGRKRGEEPSALATVANLRANRIKAKK